MGWGGVGGERAVGKQSGRPESIAGELAAEKLCRRQQSSSKKPASADIGRHGSAAPTGSQTWRKTIPDASQTTTERHHAAAGAEMLCILHVVTRGRGVTPGQFFGKIGYFGLRRQAPPRCLGWLGPPMDVFWWWVVSVWARGALCGVNRRLLDFGKKSLKNTRRLCF